MWGWGERGERVGLYQKRRRGSKTWKVEGRKGDRGLRVQSSRSYWIKCVSQNGLVGVIA